MVIQSVSLNAGHCLAGTTASGAKGYLCESTENRRLTKRVKELLEENGVKVYDSTIDRASSASICLQEIVKKANGHKADIFVSIHFNSSDNKSASGVETLVYNENSKCRGEAIRITENIAKLGFKSRGIKYRSDLYVLRNTTSTALVIEVAFVSSKTDTDLYNKNFEKVAIAITEGILNKKIVIGGGSNGSDNTTTSSSNNTTGNKTVYRILVDGNNVGAYSVVSNTLKEVEKAIEKDVKEIVIQKV